MPHGLCLGFSAFVSPCKLHGSYGVHQDPIHPFNLLFHLQTGELNKPWTASRRKAIVCFASKGKKESIYRKC